MVDSSSSIAANIRVHNRIAKRYERVHGEIYNAVEQERLRDALQVAISNVRSASLRKVALDFGCGAGNLTDHLSQLGLDVMACDVSQGFLDLVQSRPHETSVTTLVINGHDLSNVSDQSVDVVATYSVLHHVPDYLGIVSEFMRVLRPGGVIFIDHEVSGEFWEGSSCRTAFISALNNATTDRWRKYLRWENYVNWFIWKFINPRYRAEGDIHVFPDDHVEWNKVRSRVLAAGGEIISDADYLLFKEGYDVEVYAKYKSLTTDMHCLIARKTCTGVGAC